MVQLNLNLKEHACSMGLTYSTNHPQLKRSTRVTRVAWVVLWLQTRVYIEKHTRVHAHIVFIHACVFTHAWVFVYA